MPHEPNAHFDQTVLEMIEHSPTGAVPGTPAYQDALGRLYAAHKVYASADHKAGHVTVRSLGGAPVFHAANLDDLIAGKIEPAALEANGAIFDRYVRALPEGRRAAAENFRAAVAGRPVHHRAKPAGDAKLPAAHDLVHTLFLVPGTGPHHGLPGNYLHGSVFEVGVPGGGYAWAVQVHDDDDGAAVCEAASLGAALEKLQELFASAPFHLEEIVALGFRLK